MMLRTGVILAAAVAFVTLAGFAGLSVPPESVGKTDFIEYASSARLLLASENPYDASRLLQLQRSVGWEDSKAQMMWNPPWVFPFILPSGLVPWNVGLLAWIAAQFVAVIVSAVLTWRLAEGPGRLVWVAVVVALLFAPTFFLLRLGQISGFLLLGLVGFAAAMRVGRPVLAGAAASLTAIKPHLLLPFAVLLICDAFVSRATRRAVLSGGFVLALAAAFPLLWNPSIWPQYIEAIQAPGDEFHYALSDWDPPILAGKLAQSVGGGMAVQMLPSGLTTLALVLYWWRRRKLWDWSVELPRVVMLAMLTTGYGAWGFDVVVLLFPLVQTAAGLVNRSSRMAVLLAATAYVCFNCGVIMGLNPALWWTPCLALGYLICEVAQRQCSRFRVVAQSS